MHKGECYPGLHDAIVDDALWDKVHSLLVTHRVERKNGTTAQHPSLLAGLLVDGSGERMTPSHATKNGKRYRYYLSRSLTTQTRNNVPAGRRLPAADIEQLVTHRIRAALADHAMVLDAIEPHTAEATEQKQLLMRASALSQGWGEITTAKVRALLLALIARIDVLPKRVDIHLVRSRVAEVLLKDPQELPPASACNEKKNWLTLRVSGELKRAGMGMKMMLDEHNMNGRTSKPDASLAKLIIKAHALNNKLVNSGGTSIKAIAKGEGLTGSYVTRVVRLSFLSPDITRAILDGRHPADLTAAKLTRLSRLPLNWDQQKKLLGFA